MRQIRRTTGAQRGAVLIVGMIMLTVMAIAVIASFMLTSSNSRAVASLQSRNDAVNVARAALATQVSSPFYAYLDTSGLDYDVDDDGTTDYSVELSAPRCLRSTVLGGTATEASSLSLGDFTETPDPLVESEWELEATATSTNGDGTRVTIVEGVVVSRPSSQTNCTG